MGSQFAPWGDETSHGTASACGASAIDPMTLALDHTGKTMTEIDAAAAIDETVPCTQVISIT
jgi:hypothetical protein